ncbi:helix-turn-helix transcriptional regulator [Streptomyces sp. TS71-3]|uniref:helix-turn-helix domain-containing protein n=1 Tax=Streptomyces sp. TS71-3 TaxID=2733862 RepID=UPI001B0411F1|nr:helix-turn-helix transcriptional regulator [Streptomyces sp. TS71-3]GHJ36943.1 hypothetical protein Sm713_25520 [Streptomyces sp. TS71-3]
MAGRKRAPVAGDGPRAHLARRLRELRDGSGMTLRRLAERTGYSPSALSAAESGRTAPSWVVTEAFVQACGGDPAHWRQLWELADGQESAAESAAESDAPDSATPETGTAETGTAETGTPETGTPAAATPGAAAEGTEAASAAAGAGVGSASTSTSAASASAPEAGAEGAPRAGAAGPRSAPGRRKAGWLVAAVLAVCLAAAAAVLVPGIGTDHGARSGAASGAATGAPAESPGGTAAAAAPARDGTDPYDDGCRADAKQLDWEPVEWPDGSTYGTVILMYSRACRAAWGYLQGRVSHAWTAHIVARRDPDGGRAPSEYTGDQKLPGSWGNVLSTVHGCVSVEAFVTKAGKTGQHARTSCFQPAAP